MKKLWSAALALAFGGAVLSISGCGNAVAQEPGAAKAPRDIQLTIYKQDFAVVHESRPVALSSGDNRVLLDDVSKTLDPASVIFDWQGAAQTPDVSSTDYDLGVASGGSLLKRLEGKPVEMLWNSEDGKPGDKIEGTLEATEGGGFVIRSGDKLYVNPNGTIVAGGQQSLVTMPRLTAQVDSPSKQDAKLGFAYQTRGMSWSADYVGRLSPDDDSMDLECWATLTNQTGVDYPNAKITLVAGSPNRAALAAPSRQAAMGGAGYGVEQDAAKTELLDSSLARPESVGELYAYKVPASASVGEDQMNRVKMLDSKKVTIKRDYSIRLTNAPYNSYWGDQNSARQNATLAISLVNDEASGLGMPLPSGAVRIYDDSSSDATAFIGAASLADTPKNQHVSMTLSNVFDVYADSRTAKDSNVDKHTKRETFETLIHNEKKSPVDVRVVQEFYGKEHLVSESAKGVQLNSGTRQWTVRVPAGGQTKLTWTADFQR